MAERDQTFQNDPEVRAPDSWKKFQVIQTGKTNGAHKSIVKHFTYLRQTEVDSPEDSDYSLVFCPVISRVGTDISYALDRLHPDKEVVLVVMHHTFNPQQVILPSSRLVEDERVRLTLDCLFYEGNLLHSELNENMKTTIKTFFGVSHSKTLQQLVVWFFLVLSSFLVSMWRLLAAPFQFVLVRTGWSRLDPPASGPSWKRFDVVQTGRTNGAHKSIVKLFTSLGQTEEDSSKDSDYSLVFCPVVSRVGTDISYALDRLHPDKEVVLVVMHHTFNPQQVIPPSSRLVEDERVRLTLDCLFYEGNLLHSELNENMKTTIKTFFNVSLFRTLQQLVVWFFLVLSSFLVSMLDSIAAAFQFILSVTGLNRLLRRHSSPSVF